MLSRDVSKKVCNTRTPDSFPRLVTPSSNFQVGSFDLTVPILRCLHDNTRFHVYCFIYHSFHSTVSLEKKGKSIFLSVFKIVKSFFTAKL